MCDTLNATEILADRQQVQEETAKVSIYRNNQPSQTFDELMTDVQEYFKTHTEDIYFLRHGLKREFIKKVEELGYLYSKLAIGNWTDIHYSIMLPTGKSLFNIFKSSDVFVEEVTAESCRNNLTLSNKTQEISIDTLQELHYLEQIWDATKNNKFKIKLGKPRDLSTLNERLYCDVLDILTVSKLLFRGFKIYLVEDLDKFDNLTRYSDFDLECTWDKEKYKRKQEKDYSYTEITSVSNLGKEIEKIRQRVERSEYGETSARLERMSNYLRFWFQKKGFNRWLKRNK